MTRRAADEAAFREYVALRQRALRRTAFLMCGDWHNADDLVQTTLTKLYLAWPRIRKDRGPDAYAHRILANVAIDESRRPWRREVSTDDIGDRVDAATTTSGSDSRLDLAGALAALPKAQRITVVLRFWVDASVAETADTMGCSPGTVKSQTARALIRLRELLPAADIPLTPSEELR